MLSMRSILEYGCLHRANTAGFVFYDHVSYIIKFHLDDILLVDAGHEQGDGDLSTRRNRLAVWS